MTKKRLSQSFTFTARNDYQPNLLDFSALNLKIKNLKNSLKNAEEMYRKLIITSNDAIFIIDKNLDILFSSEKAIQMFGFHINENLEGKNFLDLVNLSERKNINDMLKRVFKEGFIGNIKSKFIRDGHEFYGISNAAFLHNADNIPFALIVTVRELGEQKEMDLQCLQGSEIYKLAFDSANDAIVLHTLKNGKPSNFFIVNESACKQLGLSKDEILKYTPFDFYAFPDDKKKLNLEREFKNKNAITFEMPIQRSDGSIIICEVNSKIIKYKNKPVVLSVIRDVSERRNFQKQIENNFLVMKRIMDGIITTMEKLIEKKDIYTVGHQRRTAELAKFIAKEYGLSDSKAEGIYIAALIHDIGKIFISSSILNKKEKLDEKEYEIIKSHPVEGYNILKSVYFPWPIAEIIYQHHERINGSGYPRGLKKNKILLEAKIIGIADVIEAMTFKRPYRKALGINSALDEIIKNRGILYDEKISDISVDIFRKRRFKF